jgi:small-conductance mechanosensitive channel
MVALAVPVSTSPLVFPPRVAGVVLQVAKLVLLWQLAIWSGTGVGFWVKHYLDRRSTASDRASVAMVGAMGVAAKVLLWLLIFLTTLKSVFGVEITALITGLGVSGIAVALAVQNILGDIFAALAIVFDKPFDVGDSIGVDQISGTVEHIGLKTTRVRSVNGEQIVIGNADLLKSRLRNFRRMYQRRTVLVFDVTYDTPPDLLARLPRTIEEIISAQTPVKFDRCHVASLGESAVRLEAVYYVLDPDYMKFMNIQQAVLLETMRRFAALGVGFAFPSRTVYHEGLTAANESTPRPPQSTAP